MIVVDTSVWIASLRNRETAAVRMLGLITPNDRILIGDIVLLEVLQGARDAGHAERLAMELRAFTPVEMMSREIAVAAAGHYRTLRSLGVTVRKTADLIIATFCIAGGHTLLDDDRDFLPFKQHLGLSCLDCS